MDNRDDVMLGWLARECRFYLGVNLCERSPIGYAVKRRCVIAKDDSSLLQSWLSERHDINARSIQDTDTIRKVIEILKPYQAIVKDKRGMENMEKALNLFPRRWKHDDVLRFVAFLDGESPSFL